MLITQALPPGEQHAVKNSALHAVKNHVSMSNSITIAVTKILTRVTLYVLDTWERMWQFSLQTTRAPDRCAIQ